MNAAVHLSKCNPQLLMQERLNSLTVKTHSPFRLQRRQFGDAVLPAAGGVFELSDQGQTEAVTARDKHVGMYITIIGKSTALSYNDMKHKTNYSMEARENIYVREMDK